MMLREIDSGEIPASTSNVKFDIIRRDDFCKCT